MTPAMNRILMLAMLAAPLMGCQKDAQLEGDNAGNYRRVFGMSIPGDVDVVHSVVMTYPWRPFAVTTDDFEFELLAPRAWIVEHAKNLRSGSENWIRKELGDRQSSRGRSWYAPKPIEAYELYRDMTSVGYVHMLVDEEMVNGRCRVFYSKH